MRLRDHALRVGAKWQRYRYCDCGWRPDPEWAGRKNAARQYQEHLRDEASKAESPPKEETPQIGSLSRFASSSALSMR